MHFLDMNKAIWLGNVNIFKSVRNNSLCLNEIKDIYNDRKVKKKDKMLLCVKLKVLSISMKIGRENTIPISEKKTPL